MSAYNSIRNHKTLFYFCIISILAFAIRAYINFSSGLLIGNGGYYPLQVRTVLERGELAFSDMPLLFYFDASIIKLITLFGAELSDTLILFVVQLIDSLSIPLLLIPLYQILKLTHKAEFSIHTIVVSSYSVLSFYTLVLVSSSQKNALGITFLLCAVYWLFKYLLENEQNKNLALSILFLGLTGFTHFGTFVFAMIIGGVYIIFRYQKKALLPIGLLLLSGLTIIYLFDPVRLERLISVAQDFLSNSPRPTQFFSLLIYGLMAFIAYKIFNKHKNQFNDAEKTIILTLVTILVVVPLPIVNPQFTHRITAFLFIPQVLLFIYLSPFLKSKLKNILTSLFGLVTVMSVAFFLFKPPGLTLSKAALKDLQQVQLNIENTEKAVVISRHNLEFWVAFSLHVNVSQESKFDAELIEDYERIFIINQTKG